MIRLWIHFSLILSWCSVNSLIQSGNMLLGGIKSLALTPAICRAPSGSRLFASPFPKSKTKVGRPQRKQFSGDSNSFGRVSVYCVGDSINIKSLRSHIFRRGFGTQKEINNSSQSSLTLTRSYAMENDDDEVLHVSNAPLFITVESSKTMPGDVDVSIDDDALRDRLDMVTSEESRPDQDQGTMWGAKEAVLMATQDIFYFDYGTVVFWGLTIQEERAAMTELVPFSTGSVSSEELEESYDIMEYTYDKKANPQRPIRSDRMRLSSLALEEKLAFSYAMAQSSKLFVFETKVLNAVEATRYLPRELSLHGRITSSKKDLNKLIGTLFVEQTEVNLFSSILDTPDFLWDDEQHLNTYKYTRSYLEVDARITLLNRRLQIIRELLDVLTAQVTDSNSERLEWIIIWLIAIEIVMGIVSNPMFAGKKAIACALVPAAILAYRKLNWLKDSD